MLPEIPGLGVWRLESHGYYAAIELSATAGMLEQATANGQMFPARLRIDQRAQIKDGKTTRYAVPVIDIDVRFREALGGLAQPVAIDAPLGHTPLPLLESNGVTVQDGLDAAARQSEPKAQSSRSAAPIGAVGDFSQDTPVPVPDDDGSISTVVEPKGDRTPAQAKKLNVLVGKLREGGKITTQQLYNALAKTRNLEVSVMADLVRGEDLDGLHWGPLRDSLTKLEASDLIERLTALEETP
jgi:hypothetical protein